MGSARNRGCHQRVNCISINTIDAVEIKREARTLRDKDINATLVVGHMAHVLSSLLHVFCFPFVFARVPSGMFKGI